MTEAKAILRYLRVSPRKVRLLANLVRGLSVAAALHQLQVSRKAARMPLGKLIHSAVANAEDRKMDKDSLFIKQIMVDGGPMLKRFRPRAMGRAAPIHHHSSHITVVLAEKKQPVADTAVKSKKSKIGSAKAN